MAPGPFSSHAEIFYLLMELLVQNTIQAEIQNAHEIKNICVSIIALRPIICNAWGKLLSNWYGRN